TQKSLLPQSLPEFPNFGIDAYSKPTRYVGGDFYDFLPLDSKKLLGILADVSGKGISAALLGSLLQGALEVEFRSATKPEEALNRVNKFLCEKTQPDRFVTLFLFVLNSQGKGQFISAGHNPAYLFRAATGKVEELTSDGFILGAFAFASYSSRPFQLRKGDVLLIYSDGLTDAQNHEEEVFGEERLLEIIQREAPAGGQVLKKKLLEALAYFTHGMPQTDDITFLLIEKQR
ncbi:MAG: PP2C family protein-serine/threonine phosphatase, partial [Acidobacteria bacterium]|nr:PP2C family protein-serine/threonine phosphatase [Acidobacteriota bacterium]